MKNYNWYYKITKRDEKMNDITLNDIKTKSRQEIINICKQFPYRSKWENKDAYEFAEYEIALTQGARYLKTGSIKSFTKSVL